MLDLDGSIGNQHQDVNSIKGMVKRRRVVIVGLSYCGPGMGEFR